MILTEHLCAADWAPLTRADVRRFDPDDAISNVSETGASNGLNQLTQYAGKSLTHDTKGNVSGFGTDSFVYSSENLLTNATVGATSTALTYDPMLRLSETSLGGATSRFAYDGLDAIAEHDGVGALQRRWLFDPTIRQAVVWYEGTGTTAADRRYLSSDERGSVISVSDSAGAVLAVNTYDEFGTPAATNLGRFQYTGQVWLPELRLYYYKARFYSPALGRFLQTDRIGYAAGANLYAYVSNDPINLVDPLGFDEMCTGSRLCGAGYAIGVMVTSTAGAMAAAGKGYGTPGSTVSSGVATAGSTGSGAAPTYTSGAGVIVVTGTYCGSCLPYDSSGLFFMTSGTVTSNRTLNEIVVTAYRKQKVGGVYIDFSLPWPQEQLWAIYPGGEFVFVPTRAEAVNNEARNRGTAPRPGFIATAHVHTFEIAGPGAHDFGSLLPVYIFSPNGVYVIMPDSLRAMFLGR